MAKQCPNCGLDIEAVCLGEIPVEELVSDDVRLAQYSAAMAGKESRHSVDMAANSPVLWGEQ
jgi:hypothetical protein